MSTNGYSFGVSTRAFDEYVTTTLTGLLSHKVQDFKPGDEVNVTLTGKVMPSGQAADWEFVAHARPDYLTTRELYLTDRKVTNLTVTKKAPQPPKWQPGDVVTIKFDAYGSPYTYVRGSKDWPGENVKLTDAKVDDYYRTGKAKHLVRNGQKL
jgi:hypothetical protein